MSYTDNNVASSSTSASSSTRPFRFPPAEGREELYSTHTAFDSIGEDSPVKLPIISAQSQFDSLHDLLQKAGYKETRIVTPDRRGLADMAARQFVPPHSRVAADSSAFQDSPSSKAAEQLKKAVQNRPAAPRGYSSKSLPSRAVKPSKAFNAAMAPELPNPVPLSSWLSNLWIFGPGLVSKSPDIVSATSDKQESEPLLQDVVPKPDDNVAIVPASVSPKKPAVKKAPSQNQVWTASVAYRSAKSRTAPVRGKSGVVKAIASGSDESAAAAEWSALQNGGGAKKRPGLVDAFSSPSKAPTSMLPKEETSKRLAKSSSMANDSPTKQRKCRQDRAAWRESLGDLQAMMDKSRQRRDANTSAPATTPIQENSETSDFSVEPTSSAIVTDADQALTNLLSGPALPFLSTDPAVAPRNGACTRPAHLSVRRMKSVEVLSKIIKERRSVSEASTRMKGDKGKADGSGIGASNSSSPLSSKASVVFVNGTAGNISPSSKRSTPPRLTISSPRGITSPQALELAGLEYEPWSPQYQPGTALISTRRLAKKSRGSRLRHTASTSNLRSDAQQDEDGQARVEQAKEQDALKAPRSRSKSKTSKSTPNREQDGSIARNATGTLSRASQIQALARNTWSLDEFTVFQDTPTQSSDRSNHHNRNSEERGRSIVPIHAARCKPLGNGSGMNGETRGKDGDEDDEDVFRCTLPQSSRTNEGNAVLKKKHFTAKVTKTSKIMRLIDEAENVPSIASMISSTAMSTGPRDSPTLNRVNSRSTTSQTSANRTSSLHRREVENVDPYDQHPPLSSSLSKKSKDRMQTITRVLGQRPSLTQFA